MALITLAYIIIATLIVSLISIIGIITLFFKKSHSKEMMLLLVAFAAGTLLATSLLELVPESIALSKEQEESLIQEPEHIQEHAEDVHEGHDHFGSVGFFMLVGMALFYLIEKFVRWHHHHDIDCHKHSLTTLSLAGDAVHNFIDGLLIAGSFILSPITGVITTLAIIFHEIPQEIGDFAILIHGGFSKMKALLFNFISALFAVLGGIAGFMLLTVVQGALAPLIAITAGSFIYIALADIIPELHKDKGQTIGRTTVSLAVLVGIIVVTLVVGLIPH